MASSSSQLKRYSGPWTETQIRHLLIRTLFGVPHIDLSFFREKSMDECLEILLKPIPLPILPIELHESPDMICDPDDKIPEPKRTEWIGSWWIRQMVRPQKILMKK